MENLISESMTLYENALSIKKKSDSIPKSQEH